MRAYPDLFGQSLLDYITAGALPHPVHLRRDDGRLTPLPLAAYFDSDMLSPLEAALLALAQGRVLDLGAGAGRAALWLQRHPRVSEVVAVDSSAGACECMRRRGVQRVIHAAWQEFGPPGVLAPASGYDTILLLGSGLGMAGSPSNLHQLLHALQTWLNPAGQALVTASRPAALGIETSRMRVEYRGKIGDWFEWLLIEEANLRAAAVSAGWDVIAPPGGTAAAGDDREYGLVLHRACRA